MPHVPAVLELAKLFRQVLRADVNVRPVDAALQHGPEAFNVVHRLPLRAGILFLLVANEAVPVAVLSDVLVAAERVGMDVRAGQDVLVQHRQKRVFFDVGNDVGD